MRGGGELMLLRRGLLIVAQGDPQGWFAGQLRSCCRCPPSEWRSAATAIAGEGSREVGGTNALMVEPGWLSQPASAASPAAPTSTRRSSLSGAACKDATLPARRGEAMQCGK